MQVTDSIQHQSTSSVTSICSLIKKRSWSQVQQAVTHDHTLAIQCPTLRGAHCNYSHIPLLLACRMNPPVSIITSLLKANPSAVFERDSKGRLPLHLACEYGASSRVIRTILNANPQAVSMKDGLGMLPIHKIYRFHHEKARSSRSVKIVSEKRIKKNIRIVTE